MEFKTIKEKAEEWELSEKRVQVLCNENRVFGAQKIGGSWIIPAEAKQPIDNRIKKDEIINDQDINAIIELLTENSKVYQEYKIRYDIEKDSMLNPLYRLKQLYVDIFVLDKYYRVDLVKYVGLNLDDVDIYLKSVESKLILMEIEPKTEINKLIITITKLMKNVLELIKNQKENYGYSTEEAQKKFDNEHMELLIEFIDIIVEHHGNEIKDMFDSFMNLQDKEDGED